VDCRSDRKVKEKTEVVEQIGGFLRGFLPLKERKLELNVDKSKVLVFSKGGKGKKMKWRWGGKEIEEVQNFKYLGFTFNRKRNYKEHIAELARKGRIAVKKIWGLGERMCRNDFIRRWNLFRYLVQSVLNYGVELWGWEERVELEKIMMDYIRWLFGLDFCTPRYIISREIGMEKLRLGWGIRAKWFEERIRGGEERLMRECWKEKVIDGWKDLYGKERIEFYTRYGMWTGGNEERNPERGAKEIMERERAGRRGEKNLRIEEARYNRRYKEILAKGKIPRYLMRDRIEKIELEDMVRALARLRCENMEEWNKYWLEEEVRRCVFL